MIYIRFTMTNQDPAAQVRTLAREAAKQEHRAQRAETALALVTQQRDALQAAYDASIGKVAP